MNMGLEIVTADWIENSLAYKEFLPTKNYAVSSDTNVNISAIAHKGEYALEDKDVWMTSSVRPLAKEWKNVITTAGGTLLNKRPKIFDEDTIIIATDAKSDEKNLDAFRSLGYKIHDAEYLLSGIMTHKFQPERAFETLQEQHEEQERAENK
jgi:hypothetical protein